jgi:hypothetical protein
VWYTGQFYAQSFLENVCKIDFEQSRTILIWAILFATPFFIVFGAWSDKVGRKWIMLAGMLLAICTYRPLFSELQRLSTVNESMELTEKKEILSRQTRIEGSNDFLRTSTTKRYFADDVVLCERQTRPFHPGEA